MISHHLQYKAYIQSAKFLIHSYTLNTHNLLQGMLQGVQALNIHTPMHLQHDGTAWHLTARTDKNDYKNVLLTCSLMLLMSSLPSKPAVYPVSVTASSSWD
jgi:hypothetical protein